MASRRRIRRWSPLVRPLSDRQLASAVDGVGTHSLVRAVALADDATLLLADDVADADDAPDTAYVGIQVGRPDRSAWPDRDDVSVHRHIAWRRCST